MTSAALPLDSPRNASPICNHYAICQDATIYHERCSISCSVTSHRAFFGEKERRSDRLCALPRRAINSTRTDAGDRPLPKCSLPLSTHHHAAGSLTERTVVSHSCVSRSLGMLRVASTRVWAALTRLSTKVCHVGRVRAIDCSPDAITLKLVENAVSCTGATWKRLGSRDEVRDHDLAPASGPRLCRRPTT